MNATPVRIVMVAGEASGDLLGSHVIAALKERYPQAEFFGIGGPKMIGQGFDSWVPQERLAVHGLVEVLKHLPGLVALRRELVRRIAARRPHRRRGEPAGLRPRHQAPAAHQRRRDRPAGEGAHRRSRLGPA